MTGDGERTPLLRQASSRSYRADDAVFAGYAAEAAVGAIADGAADPSREDERNEEESRKIDRRTLAIVLIGLWASNFTFAVQSSAVPTLAPRISASFAHSELASYLGSIFPLFSTAFTPVYGVLLDTIGRRGAMVTAAVLYGLGTLACGLSPTMGLLISARALAGAGGAGLLTVSAVITTDLVSLRERGFYQVPLMIVFGLGASVGGPVSGWIADRFSWPWAFYVQLPFLLLSISVICVYLPVSTTSRSQSGLWKALRDFDSAGTLMLLGSISSLLLAFSNHTAFLYPWSDHRVWGLLLSFGILLCLFIAFEGWFAKRPIVPLSLFTGQTLPCIFASNFTLSVAAQTFVRKSPVYFTSVLDSTSATAGAHLLPNSIGLAIGSILAGHIIKKTGKYTRLSALGLAMPILSIYSASKWTRDTPEWAYWAAVFPAGLGYSIFLCAGLVAMIAAVDPAVMPQATSLLYTFRSLGTTVGIALSSSLQQAVFVNRLSAIFAPLHPQEREKIINSILHAKSAIYSLPPRLQAEVEQALANSISWTFVSGCIAAVLCLASSLPIRERNLDEKHLNPSKPIDHDPSEGEV
ncbi:hypothetical protein FFLO_04259 [Filobasidium floriforme]|uniref:Major facilitator superfamily (MFS) profile domain-containing protein n=1 Tax=Filobasidium floriforme TaxID=5210 RepID=A0A8K0NMI8_9TREE|nr:hypothetical protein FFLO_04259 [Filobasidium floriforme]